MSGRALCVGVCVCVRSGDYEWISHEASSHEFIQTAQKAPLNPHMPVSVHTTPHPQQPLHLAPYLPPCPPPSLLVFLCLSSFSSTLFLCPPVHSNQPRSPPAVKNLTVALRSRSSVAAPRVSYVYMCAPLGCGAFTRRRSGWPGPIDLASLLHFGGPFFHPTPFRLTSSPRWPVRRPVAKISSWNWLFGFVIWDAEVVGLF